MEVKEIKDKIQFQVIKIWWYFIKNLQTYLVASAAGKYTASVKLRQANNRRTICQSYIRFYSSVSVYMCMHVWY